MMYILIWVIVHVQSGTGMTSGSAEFASEKACLKAKARMEKVIYIEGSYGKSSYICVGKE